MRRVRKVAISVVAAALSSACFAAGPAARASPPPAQTAPGQTAPAPAAAPAPQGPAKVCVDVQTSDALTKEFADLLQAAIAASGTLSPASAGDTCNLQLHVPGNLLRFQTAGGVMVGTVVIVTSSSGQYLSTSVTACETNDFKPCALRAVAAAKLALLMSAND